MVNEKDIPILLEFIFGDAAPVAQRGASPRLLRWAEAFDHWLAERGNKVKLKTNKETRIAWRRLLGERKLMPWQLTQLDIEAHIAWMVAEEYSLSTINDALKYIAMFYRWCDERSIDPEGEPGFNPAAGVKRPHVVHYANAQLLSRAEIAALLDILAKDETSLGLRDYAFFLARLRVVVPLKYLQQLQWGQLEQVEEVTPSGEMRDTLWIRCSPQVGSSGRQSQVERWQLPWEVWRVILEYLIASGRLPGMQGAHYIFAPLAYSGSTGENDRAQDWVADRYVSGRQFLKSLKLYGRLVGIAEEKLNLAALRNTAIRLHLDQGADNDEMQTFLYKQESTGFSPDRFAGMPELPEEQGWQAIDVEAPDRSGKPFKPGEGIMHGFYAHELPEGEIQAVLEEEIKGIEEEIAGLDQLLGGLTARYKKECDPRQRGKLVDALTLTAYRLSEMRAVEGVIAKGMQVAPWVYQMLDMIDRVAQRKGDPELGVKARAEALGDGPEQTPRMLQIASVRFSLRNTLELALGAQEVNEYLRWVEIYGKGSMRLMRMLKKEALAPSQAEERVREAMHLAIQDVLQGWRPES
jgi:hypothetical protein